MIKKPGEELGNGDLCINDDGSLSYRAWIKGGSMIYNRDCLGHDDPFHIYNLVESHGLNPDDFGIKHPRTGEFDGWSRDRLVNEILKLQDTIESAMRHGFM